MNSAIERYREDEGFTLIELLVVVIIIGILAAIAIPAFLNQRENAYVAAAESDARNVAIEVESIFTRTGAYPTDAVTLTPTNTPAPFGDVQVSQNVFLDYNAIGTNGFQIDGRHNLVDGGTPDVARYCSTDGGVLQAAADGSFADCSS